MSNTNSDTWGHLPEYHEPLWGELILGTAAQLQALGLGLDIHFPKGHVPRNWRRHITDPRGFHCCITVFSPDHGGIFSASINFPGRDGRPSHRTDRYASPYPGISMCNTIYSDLYFGSGAALVKAGLAKSSCLPSEPDMPKHTVSLSPSGEVLVRSRARLARLPGGRTITREKAGWFCLSVTVTSEIATARDHDQRMRERQWELAMMALPRPPRLDAPAAILNDHAARRRRASIRLVWSDSALCGPTLAQDSRT